ncbi:MAG: hypothetical protein ALECFALPRED_004256 [Alectoria fallacina]|uniref:Uncharacterized protein n=1 Tax=Alectoria fallacina TaxID=1903189 RepID=A0A8H3FSD9_9LECA|nr:MAG: hypothetical protein ALECFALPRED_004256 [Alectoria fallacina]
MTLAKASQNAGAPPTLTSNILVAEMINRFPTETGFSPPFDNTLVRRAFILDYQKPSASRLRNEIHKPPADDAQKASEFVKTKNITLSTSPKCYEGVERVVPPLLTGSEENLGGSSSGRSLLADIDTTVRDPDRRGTAVDVANRLHLVGVIVPATAILVVSADQAAKRETKMSTINMRTERCKERQKG